MLIHMESALHAGSLCLAVTLMLLLTSNAGGPYFTTNVPVDNFVVTCGRNIATSGKISTLANGATTSEGAGGQGNCQLTINSVQGGAVDGSQWELSRLYVWDTHLPDDVFSNVSAALTGYLSNSSVCVCPAGYSCTADSLLAVRQCDAGTYSTAGATACSSCPTHSDSLAGSEDAAECTCNAGFTGSGIVGCTACAKGTSSTGNSCQDCGPGTFSNITASTYCATCPAGKYSAATAATSCTGCLANAYSADGSIAITNCTCNVGYTGADGETCQACVAGTYKPTHGSGSCSLCSQGTYSTETGETSGATCTSCPESSWSQAGSDDIADCICKAGYSASGGQGCSACQAGTFKDVNGSAPCSLCPQGKYSTGTAETSDTTCSACPQPHTYSGAGSSTVTNCTCNLGHTGPDGGPCTPCVAGKYKDVNGSVACSLCEAGKYSTGTASTCALCPEDTLSIAGSPALTNCICNLGYTGPDGGACEPCAAGSYKDVNGSQACALCPDGTYSTGVGQVSDATCSLCPEGKYSTEMGETSAATCSDCPAAKFKALRGNGSCIPCAPNSWSPPGSTAQSACLCSPGFTHLDCLPCPRGTFKPARGSLACEVCEPGLSSPQASSSQEACSRLTAALHLSVALDIPLADFVQPKQDLLLMAIAAAANVQVFLVKINRIESATGLRRRSLPRQQPALQEGVVLDLEIGATDERQANLMAAELTQNKVETETAKLGLPRAVLLAAPASVQSQPNSDASWSSGSAGSEAAGGARPLRCSLDSLTWTGGPDNWTALNVSLLLLQANASLWVDINQTEGEMIGLRILDKCIPA